MSLLSFSVVLSWRAVQWFTDNRNIPSIIRNGSMKRDLHEISLSIFQLVLRNGIDLQVDWIPRSLNEHADAISRIVDFDDWGVSFEFFHHVDNIWGPHSVDRFVHSHNRKLPRFFSRFWNPDWEGVDAFCIANGSRVAGSKGYVFFACSISGGPKEGSCYRIPAPFSRQSRIPNFCHLHPKERFPFPIPHTLPRFR